MEELAHDLLATDNHSCGSLGPTTGRSSSTSSGHGDRGERHAHIVARHGQFQCAEGGVWFVPKVAPSKHWVAKILVEVLVAHDLADIGKKNELELSRVHWHAKEMATIQTKTNLWVMTKILVRCTLATIQTHPNTRLVEDAWGAGTCSRSGVARPPASSGPETKPGRLAFSMTCVDRM